MSDSELKNKVNDLLQQGRKIDAIKCIREQMNVSLIEAKNLAEAAENELKASGLYRPPAAPIGLTTSSLIFFIFGFIGAILLLVALFLFWLDKRNTENSIPVPGIVVRLVSNGGATAPVVEYDWQGSKRIYSSSVFSSPSAFVEGETVEMLVDADHPGNAVINQFTERYLLVVVLGFIGFVFTFISVVAWRLNR